MSGPMVTMQCMKYELKHGFSKRLASINCNFRNICKSVACKHQVLQCAAWSGSDLRNTFECASGSTIYVQLLVGYEAVKECLQLDDDSEVFVTSHIVIFGLSYRKGQFVITRVRDDILQFCQICSIIVVGKTTDEIYFVLQKYQTNGYIARVHGYEINETGINEYSVATLPQLIDHRPISSLRA